MIRLTDLLLEGAKEQAAVDYLSREIKKSKYRGKVYLAGGYVRDELLGLNPKDIDLVVDMPNGGIEFAKWFTKKIGAHSSSNPVIYPKFGTAKFNLRGVNYKGYDLSDIDIEVVMPRKEKYTKGSRKPEVSQGTMKDDVERRDFTVNSLLKDLTTGEVKDLTGMGKKDIERGVIQTAMDPDVIFKEDPLRMLRAIRFTVKYGWDLPLFMIRAIKKNASSLKYISAERIQTELNKMLVTGKPDVAIRLIQITGLSKYMMPELDLMIGMTQNKYHIWDVNKHTLHVLKNAPPDLQTRLAALFHDIGKPETRRIVDNAVRFWNHEQVGADIARDIMKRLKYPNHMINSVTKAVKNHMRLKQAGIEGEVISDKALRKLQADLGPHLEMTLDLMHADNIAHHPEHAMEKQIPNIRKRLKNLKAAPTNSKIPIPINGNDVMRELGIRPGPLVKTMLDVVRDAWFENPDITKPMALELIRTTFLGMAKKK